LVEAAKAYGDGDFHGAAIVGRTVLAADPTDAEACNLVGLADFARGDHAEGLRHLEQATALAPANAEYANNLGVILHRLGDFVRARDAFEQALACSPQMAHAANNLGSVLERLGDDGGAIGQCRRALAIDPAYVEARDNLALVCARVAPQWHFPMMADHARNAAYAAAIARAVPGKRVLDIGAGSGLLAMMAARSGAAHVVSCEMQPVIAEVARHVVAANDLSDRIEVWSLKSDQLQIGSELSAPAEVLITETFASGLLSEQVLSTVEDARRRLLTPDAVVVPQRASARAYLIGGSIVEEHLFAASAERFDLSPFDLFAPSKLGIHLDRLPHDVLSEDFELFAFDLTADDSPPERRRIEVEAVCEGRCVGVAAWIRLDLDEVTTYENRPSPDAGSNGWMHVVHRLTRPMAVKPGDRVPLLVSHNRLDLAIGLDHSA
jgi:type II protein arginine methyltransferase